MFALKWFVHVHRLLQLPVLTSCSILYHTLFLTQLILNYYIFELHWRFWFMKSIEVIADLVYRFSLLKHFLELLRRFWWKKVLSELNVEKKLITIIFKFKRLLGNVILTCLKFSSPANKFPWNVLSNKRHDPTWNLAWNFFLNLKNKS